MIAPVGPAAESRAIYRLPISPHPCAETEGRHEEDPLSRHGL